MEQLQQTLNEAIRMGWKLKGYEDNIFIKSDVYYKGCTFKYSSSSEEYGEYIGRTPHQSHHELFSKDSGLMEFMDWKVIGYMHFIETNSKVIYNTEREYHYMMMGPMTAQEKINYFNTNAYLPGKQ